MSNNRNNDDAIWRQLLRLRWPVAVTVALTFALGQLAEQLLLNEPRPLTRLLFDVLLWALIGGLTVALGLTWLSRRERGYQDQLRAALAEQRRANSQLALLREVNGQIADSLSLDDLLDAALAFPQRLVPAQAAALLLADPSGPVQIRSSGASADQLARWRSAHGVLTAPLPAHPALQNVPSAPPLLLLGLRDAGFVIGWIELYGVSAAPPADEVALLATIGDELAEAVVSQRRRSEAERAVYALEQAIADERARIARDVHDGIAQSLAFVRMRVDLWRGWVSQDPGRLDAELVQLKATLRGQIAELRRAIFALRPVQFDELGFVGGLDRYIVEFANQHGWAAEVDLSSVPPALTPAVEAICFRVIQEALTNAAKHASPTRVQVRIAPADGGLLLSVSDDGQGFDPSADAPSGHLGLRQMRERLTAVRGQLTIISRPGQGTEVRAWLPL